jgi:hypothetical protein
MDWLAGTFSLVNNIYVTGSLSALIVTIAVCSWIWLVDKPTRQLKSTLDDILSELAQVARPVSESEYVSLDERMNASLPLRPSWHRYTENIRETTLQSFSPAAKAFTFEDIVPRQMNLALVDSIPNLLLGIGLLFTFMGLIAALYFASQGVAAASTEEAKRSLGDLLHAATFKFVTSLVGLFCSMVFTVGERRRLNTISSRITLLTDQLDELIPVRGVVQIQIETLEESTRQTAQLKRFNTDLAASIAGELQGRLEPALQKTTDSLTAAILNLGNHLGDRLGDMNQEAIRKMLEAFSETLRGQTEAQANALNESLAKQIENVAAVNSIISETPDKLKEQLESILATMNESSAGMTAKLDEAAALALGAFEEGANRVRDIFTSAVDGMGQSLRSLDDLVRTTKSELADGIQQFELTVASLRDFASHLKDTLAELEKAALPVSESAKAMTDCARQMAELQEISRNTLGQAVELSRTATTDLRATGEAIREVSAGTAAAIRQAFDSYNERFDRVDHMFAATTGSLETMIETYQTRVNSFAGDLDKHLSIGMSKLGGGVEFLKEAIDELEDVLKDTLTKLGSNSAVSDGRVRQSK